MDLMSRQAEWSEQSSDFEAAADMFVKARRWAAGAREAAAALQRRSLLFACLLAAVGRKWAADLPAAVLCTRCALPLRAP